MLQQRVISAIVFLTILVASIWFGCPWFSLVTGAAAFLGFREFHHLAGKIGQYPSFSCGFIFIALVAYLADQGQIQIYTAPTLSGIVILSLIWIVLRSLAFRSGVERAFSDWIWTLGGILYLGWLLGFWILIRNSFGWEWTLLAILTTFAVDTGAYFIGRARGKHTLAPKASPGKTYEGAIGGLGAGVAAAVLLSFLLGLIERSPFCNSPGMSVKLWEIIVLGIVIGVLAQLGDLAESMLKRGVGTGEAGKLIPGHGGILDRLDSIVLTGVVIYYYLCIVA